jgi:hypothetical protein
MPSLNSNTFIVVADVKEELGIEGTDDDDFIINLINRVTDYIDRYCKRTFNADDYSDEMHSGDDTNYLLPRYWPINSIVRIQHRKTTLNTDSWSTIDSKYYHIEGHNKEVVFKTGIFTQGVNNYRISYNGGYSTIPEDLKMACIQIVKKFFNDRKGSHLKSESLGEYSYTRFDKDIKELGFDYLLDGYRVPTL